MAINYGKTVTRRDRLPPINSYNPLGTCSRGFAWQAGALYLRRRGACGRGAYRVVKWRKGFPPADSRAVSVSVVPRDSFGGLCLYCRGGYGEWAWRGTNLGANI